MAEHQAESNSNIIELKEISAMVSQLFENWRENFRQECEREGKLKGEAKLLQRQLTKRFGSLSQESQDRIANASLEQLYTWVGLVLETPNLDAVLEMV